VYNIIQINGPERIKLKLGSTKSGSHKCKRIPQKERRHIFEKENFLDGSHDKLEMLVHHSGIRG